MPITYHSIETKTLTSAQTTVTFGAGNTLPQTYTDLVLVISGRTSAGSNAYINMQFNGDTGANYSYIRMWSNGSGSGSSDQASNQSGSDIGYLPGTNGADFGITVAHIMNYSNSTTNKITLVRWQSVAAAASYRYVLSEGSMWRNQNAITKIDLAFATGDFVSGSTLSLYGIKAA